MFDRSENSNGISLDGSGGILLIAIIAFLFFWGLEGIESGSN